LVYSGSIAIAQTQPIELLQSGKLAEDDGAVARLSRSWIALEAQLFKSSAVLNNMIQLAKVFDPIVTQI